jgi:hypothetical protein
MADVPFLHIWHGHIVLLTIRQSYTTQGDNWYQGSVAPILLIRLPDLHGVYVHEPTLGR